jgi:hypothetical protein
MSDQDLVTLLPIVVASLRPTGIDGRRTVVLGGPDYIRLRDRFHDWMQRRGEQADAGRPMSRRKAFVCVVDELDINAYVNLDEKGAWLEYNRFCDAMERTQDTTLAEQVVSDAALVRLIEGMVKLLHGADCTLEIS